MNAMNSPQGVADIFASLSIIAIGVLVFLWVLIAAVAAVVAPYDRRLTFFLITLFFLGPIGIAAAAVAQPRPPYTFASKIPSEQAIPSEPAQVSKPKMPKQPDQASQPAAYDWKAALLSGSVEVTKADDEFFGQRGTVAGENPDGSVVVTFIHGSIKSYRNYDPDDLKRR